MAYPPPRPLLPPGAMKRPFPFPLGQGGPPRFPKEPKPPGTEDFPDTGHIALTGSQDLSRPPNNAGQGPPAGLNRPPSSSDRPSYSAGGPPPGLPRPPEGLRPPEDRDRRPFESSKQPPYGKELPQDRDRAPWPSYDAERHPYERDFPPYGRDLPPYDIERPPYDSEQNPYHRERQPFDRERPPHDREIPPYDKERPPYDRQRPPYERERLSYEREKPLYERERPPYDRERPQYERERLLYDRERAPYDERRPLYERERLPYERERPQYDRERPPYDRERSFDADRLHSDKTRSDFGRPPFDPNQPPFDHGRQPVDPGRPPFEPSRPRGDPGRPPADPGRPQFDPGRPQFDPGRPQFDPGRPQFDPGRPQFDPGRPPFDPSRPRADPGRPPADPGRSPADPGRPQFDPGRPPFDPSRPRADPGRPPADHGRPPFDPGRPPFDSGRPPFDPGRPPFDPGRPPFDPGRPPFDPGRPPFDPGRLPFNPGRPTLNPGRPLADSSRPPGTTGVPSSADDLKKQEAWKEVMDKISYYKSITGGQGKDGNTDTSTKSATTTSEEHSRTKEQGERHRDRSPVSWHSERRRESSPDSRRVDRRRESSPDSWRGERRREISPSHWRERERYPSARGGFYHRKPMGRRTYIPGRYSRRGYRGSVSGGYRDDETRRHRRAEWIREYERKHRAEASGSDDRYSRRRSRDSEHGDDHDQDGRRDSQEGGNVDRSRSPKGRKHSPEVKAENEELPIQEKLRRLTQLLKHDTYVKRAAISKIKLAIDRGRLNIRAAHDCELLMHSAGQHMYTGSIAFDGVFIARSMQSKKTKLQKDLYDKALFVLLTKSPEEIMKLVDPGTEAVKMELEKQLCCGEVLSEREIYQSEEATNILGTNMSIMVSDLVKAVKEIQKETDPVTIIDVASRNLESLLVKPQYSPVQPLFLPNNKMINRGMLLLGKLVLARGRAKGKQLAKKVTYENAVSRLRTAKLEDLLVSVPERDVPMAAVENQPFDVEEDQTPLKERLDNFLLQLGSMKQTESYINMLDIVAFRNNLVPMVIYKKIEDKNDTGNSMLCELYLSKILIASSRGTMKRESMAAAYKRAWELLAVSDMYAIMTEHKHITDEEIRNPELLDVIIKGTGRIVENNKPGLKRFGFSVKDVRKNKLEDFVILEHKDWSSERMNNAFCILQFTCNQTGYNLQWEVDSVQNVFRCVLSIQDQILGEGCGRTKTISRNLACLDALYKFYETHDAIKMCERVDDERHWISWETLVAEAEQLWKQSNEENKAKNQTKDVNEMETNVTENDDNNFVTQSNKENGEENQSKDLEKDGTDTSEKEDTKLMTQLNKENEGESHAKELGKEETNTMEEDNTKLEKQSNEENGVDDKNKDTKKEDDTMQKENVESVEHEVKESVQFCVDHTVQELEGKPDGNEIGTETDKESHNRTQNSSEKENGTKTVKTDSQKKQHVIDEDLLNPFIVKVIQEKMEKVAKSIEAEELIIGPGMTMKVIVEVRLIARNLNMRYDVCQHKEKPYLVLYKRVGWKKLANILKGRDRPYGNHMLVKMEERPTKEDVHTYFAKCLRGIDKDDVLLQGGDDVMELDDEEEKKIAIGKYEIDHEINNIM